MHLKLNKGLPYYLRPIQLKKKILFLI